MSGCFQCGVHFALSFKPLYVATLGPGFDFTQKFHDLCPVTDFGRIFVRNDSLDFNSHNVFVRPDQPRAPHSFALKFHMLTGQRRTPSLASQLGRRADKPIQL